MYHVTADNAFPYRVCCGQQDSGSACVQSRSDDGRITFHDWHPVNIQEYGMAAPDPHNPDIVYGGAADERLALRPPHGTDDAGRAGHVRHAARRRCDEPQRADAAAALVSDGSRTYVLRVERRVEDHRWRSQLDTDFAAI